MIAMLLNYLAGVIIITGAAFSLVAAIGVIRLPDFYSKMHAASKTGTVGSALILLALALVSADSAAASRAVAGIFFFLLTAPIAAHLLAKAGYEAGYPLWKGTVRDEMKRGQEKDSVQESTHS